MAMQMHVLGKIIGSGEAWGEELEERQDIFVDIVYNELGLRFLRLPQGAYAKETLHINYETGKVIRNFYHIEVPVNPDWSVFNNETI